MFWLHIVLVRRRWKDEVKHVLYFPEFLEKIVKYFATYSTKRLKWKVSRNVWQYGECAIRHILRHVDVLVNLWLNIHVELCLSVTSSCFRTKYLLQFWILWRSFFILLCHFLFAIMQFQNAYDSSYIEISWYILSIKMFSIYIWKILYIKKLYGEIFNDS